MGRCRRRDAYVEHHAGRGTGGEARPEYSDRGLAPDVHTETRKRSAGAVVMLKQESRWTGSTREALRTSWMCQSREQSLRS
jgi:hypothetical protein